MSIPSIQPFHCTPSPPSFAALPQFFTFTCYAAIVERRRECSCEFPALFSGLAPLSLAQKLYCDLGDADRGFRPPKGLLHCGKSCRLRWTNYLRPDIKRGSFSPEEEKLVIRLHGILGKRWAAIASQLPRRTDNEIKNLWNTHLKKRLVPVGFGPQTHVPLSISNGRNSKPSLSLSTRHMAQWESARLEAEAPFSKESLLFIPPSLGRSSSDYFLRVWNSEFGESFWNLSKGNKTPCQSSFSQASSLTRCG
ncbi:hypothetical protein Vadar_032843 [Vaccinium darrowii]|uniref:Uncharacterized protein n=1 Tax=Vaccinium darrowii TaxID=229202 RepID=A0ACB7ZG10_9ERIC|nr:hypothetical protein Vadar_032843 [Vaccinium darrowii]